MISVAVSGAAGRMGSLVCETLEGADDLTLAAAFDPAGGEAGGRPVTVDRDAVAADVVVEFTRPDVVMDNLAAWRAAGMHAVVGTSGFDAARLEDLRRAWGSGPPNCLVVPNFSIGAVLMMRLAEIAAPHFVAAEVIELHHDRKADAPSGTALATAQRISAVNPRRHRTDHDAESISGARGGDAGGVAVHSVRLPGLVAHQEVLLGNPGEVLTIRHDTTDRASFMPGVLLAIRRVAGLDAAVSVGLEELLGI